MNKQQSIHLIGIGRVAATTADDLRVGDVTIWNYGYREVVVAIEPKGAQSLTVTIRSRDGKDYQRTMRRTRLVGIAR